METGRWIRRFAGRARVGRRLRSLTGLLLQHGLWWALFLLLLHRIAPAWTLAGAVLAAVVLTVHGAAAWWRMRGETWRQLLLPVGVPRAGVIGDQLATWVWLDRSGRPASDMAAWLEDDLAVSLGSLPPENVRRIGRRPLGRTRYLIPLLVLLLLLELLQLPLPGLGGADRSLPAGGAGGSGAAGATVGGENTAPPLPLPPPPQVRMPPEQPPDPQPEDPQPPRPLIELPPEEQFVVPQYVGDGPTRREWARLARVESSGAEAAPRRPSGGAVEDPPPRAVDFEAAYERALRARHVPESERAMVRRYFDLLRREKR